MLWSSKIISGLAMLALVSIAGCTIHPPGEREERDVALREGKPFTGPRDVQPLPANPSVQALVDSALLHNAALEQQYWTWRAAIEQIPQDGTQSTTLNIAAGTNITNGHTGWDQSTVSLANDPMNNIKWPGKLETAAKIALDNAKAAGRRFFKSKYELQSKVLMAYDDYALTSELIRLEQRNQQLLSVIATTTAARNRAGNTGQRDLLQASNDVDLSANELAAMQSQLKSERAAINAMLDRAPDAPLPVPDALPPAESLAHDDAEILALAAAQNPELEALSNEIRGRENGIELARLQYVPDFNLGIGTDLVGVTQSILGQATLPIFRYEALDAAVKQAEANLHAANAARRDANNTLAAQIVADIVTLHDADRQLRLLKDTILPRARQIVQLSRSSYEAGHASLFDILDGQRSVIGLERLTANLSVTRAKRLADLEAMTGMRLTVEKTN